uniref:Photosystem I reaction center subunit IX n=1 Tax=Cuscuta erosa TaxID=437626 RepID=A0A4Y5N1D1_9ASTE|nr:photosystem I subunit IX [Cuscuta erosa]QCW07705.1 photosystem I subunit IX [Cuscuta erosa]
MQYFKTYLSIAPVLSMLSLGVLAGFFIEMNLFFFQML